MNIETRQVDQDTWVVNLSDRLDAATAGPVKDEFKRLVKGGARTLLVGLERVSFIDSSGLAALVSGLKTARTTGGDLEVFAVQQPVRIIFELTQLHRVIAIHANELEALTSV